MDVFCSYLFSDMAYEYVAISKHPDDVISLSVGHQAQTHALAHYKGSLRRGLNPSPSGVQQNKTTTTSNDETPINDVIAELAPDNGKCCSSSTGTTLDDISGTKEMAPKQASSSSENENEIEIDCDESDDTGSQHTENDPLVQKCMLKPQRYRSREAIRRRRRLYKLRKRNQQQKHLKSPQMFEYWELTITRYFQ